MRWLCIAALGFGLFAGCAHEPKLSLNSNRTLGADDYDDVLEAWTRSDELYHDLDSALFAHATFHSSELRRAFSLRHPNVYGPGSEEASRLGLTNPEAELAHEFFFSASTRDPRWNDFDRPDSIWRITLQVDDRRPVDAQVDRIKASANVRIIYPYITDFARTYRVRFPLAFDGEAVITPASRTLRLRVTSALGSTLMTWKLEPSAP